MRASADNNATVRRGVFLSLLIVQTLGCQASFPVAPSELTRRVGLQVFYTTASPSPLRVGDRLTLAAYALDAGGNFENVTFRASWASSDASVVAVDGNANTSAVGYGLAEVSASFEGQSASLLMQVSPPPRYPYIAFAFPGGGVSARALLVNETRTTSDVTTSATWTSSNPQVVTVDQGRLTARASGTVEISASYPGATGAFRFSVRPGL